MIMSQQNFFEPLRSMIGTVNTMANYSNRDIEKLFDRYNPNKIKAGDVVLVCLGEVRFGARIVGLDLDIKNKKVFANLKLLEQNKKYPIRVDVADCKQSSRNLYPGHNQTQN